MKRLELDVKAISGVNIFPVDASDMSIGVYLPSVIADSIIDDFELSLSGNSDAMKKYSRLFIALEELKNAIEDLSDVLAEDVK